MFDLKTINLLFAKELKLPRLNYTGNRKHAAIVVEEIRLRDSHIVNEFDKKINNFMKAIKKQIGKCGPSDFLLFITPIEICEAALFAIRLYREKANS
jgi:hypothetical protein